MKNLKEEIIYGKKSYVFMNNQMEVSITKQGGHMAPVIFYKNSERPINPYFISPWQFEDTETEEPNLKPLRGDFFCMPCGLPKNFQEEGFMCHGETSSMDWELEEYYTTLGLTELVLSMNSSIRAGSYKKRIILKENENVVYTIDEIDGFDGNFSMGHHATLMVPEETDSIIITTSAIQFGYTQPRVATEFSNNGEYYFLKVAERFENIEKVPTVWKDIPYIDCSKHPVINGFMGLAQLYNKQEDEPAWVIAYFPEENYFWYALKNTNELPSTVLWMENQGRHMEPWNSRTRCLGIEDMCVAIGDDDLNKNLRDELDKNKIKYLHSLKANKTMKINYIQGVHRVPENFGNINKLEFIDSGFRAEASSGSSVEVQVDWKFLFRKEEENE